MKKQKLITILFTVIFITVFSYFNFSEYKNFHQEKIKLNQNKIELKNKVENFKLENIKEINNINFYYTPNKELISEITNHIKNAKKEILLEIYILTEKSIQEQLIKAHKK
jgi:hypothetical protein